MSDTVIVAYKPKPGCEEKLVELAIEHVPFLRRLKLATQLPALVLQATDGVIVEIFEWADGAMSAAHSHPEVQALWRDYEQVCEYVPLDTLPEASEMFAQFKLIART